MKSITPINHLLREQNKGFYRWEMKSTHVNNQYCFGVFYRTFKTLVTNSKLLRQQRGII